LWSAKVDVKSSRLLSDKRETLFARDRTSKQSLFANMKQPAKGWLCGGVCNVLLKMPRSVENQVKAHVLADCLGIPGVLVVNAAARWL
jgi:hypothetical protein